MITLMQFTVKTPRNNHHQCICTWWYVNDILICLSNKIMIYLNQKHLSRLQRFFSSNSKLVILHLRKLLQLKFILFRIKLQHSISKPVSKHGSHRICCVMSLLVWHVSEACNWSLEDYVTITFVEFKPVVS